MHRDITHLLYRRVGPSTTLIVILLALAGFAGRSRLVSTLRGFAVDNEASQAPVGGYYEALIGAPEFVSAGKTVGPPPRWLAFGAEEAGIVREVSTYLRWEMRPNLDLRWNGTVFRTNSLGFRTPEIALAKPEGTYRILVFGSSNTMGYGVSDDCLYTRHLERWLNQWMGPAHPVEVVNLAVAGDSPTRRWSRLQKEAGRFDPDWVLCDASAFDPWLEDAHVHAVLQRQIPIPFRSVQEAVRRSGATAADSLESFREKFRGESERLLPDVIAGWSAEAGRLGVPLAVVILPRSDSKTKAPRMFRLISTLAGRNRLDHLDLTAAFDHLTVDQFRISKWDRHPSALGHRVIFEALRAALVRRGGLPGWPPSGSQRRGVAVDPRSLPKREESARCIHEGR